MEQTMEQIFKNYYGINDRIFSYVQAAEEKIAGEAAAFAKIKEYNALKVLKAFHTVGVEERHFYGSSGYGLSDFGREKLCELYAEIFGAEDAIVSPLIASGTHAICLALFGLLRPLDTMLCVTGRPYDTLVSALGLDDVKKSGGLFDYAIHYKEVALSEDFGINIKKVLDMLYIDKSIKIVYIQRSKGYMRRPALTIRQIGLALNTIKSLYPDVTFVVDNCYGEFCETLEPTEVGADVIVGSLIKNPGAGITPTGAYIAGTKKAMETIALRFTTPATGKEIGSYAPGYRAFFQGVYMAPTIVYTSMVGAMLFAEVFSSLGYSVCPENGTVRSDITQAITMKTEKELTAFIRAVQAASPVDHNAVPYAEDMPGYEDKVIMASGSFVQGSTIELSADAPIKPPYTAYYQGGLTIESIKLSLMLALRDMKIF